MVHHMATLKEEVGMCFFKLAMLSLSFQVLIKSVATTLILEHSVIQHSIFQTETSLQGLHLQDLTMAALQVGLQWKMDMEMIM